MEVICIRIVVRAFLYRLGSRVCTWCSGYRVMIDGRAYVYANMIDVRLLYRISAVSGSPAGARAW